MVLIVMGVPPFSMVGRHETATNLLLILSDIARREPPLGLPNSFVEILREGREKGIGQNDHFVVV
jgi:hypothetical protein